MPVGFDLRGETTSLPGVGEGGVPVASGGVCISEIDKQANARPDEVRWQASEGGGELVDRFGCANAGQRVAAPAVEECVGEEQERQRGVDRVGREQVDSGVEGSPGVIGVPAAARVSPCAEASQALNRGVAVPRALWRAWASWSTAAVTSSRSTSTKACSAVAWASRAGDSASRAAALARS
ncbi:MAG: hypothetical protein ACRDST_13310 [Pseudonocardiaceae bacterium]